MFTMKSFSINALCTKNPTLKLTPLRAIVSSRDPSFRYMQVKSHSLQSTSTPSPPSASRSHRYFPRRSSSFRTLCDCVGYVCAVMIHKESTSEPPARGFISSLNRVVVHVRQRCEAFLGRTYVGSVRVFIRKPQYFSCVRY